MSKLSIQDCTHFTTISQYDNLALSMPRKTKREKIEAKKHRKFLTPPIISSPYFVKSQVDSVSPTNSVANYSSFSYEQKIVVTPKKEVLFSNYSYVKKDLIRITIFTLLAITVQSVLYFLLLRG